VSSRDLQIKYRRDGCSGALGGVLGNSDDMWSATSKRLMGGVVFSGVFCFSSDSSRWIRRIPHGNVLKWIRTCQSVVRFGIVEKPGKGTKKWWTVKFFITVC
jgi:hypothetical protein